MGFLDKVKGAFVEDESPKPTPQIQPQALQPAPASAWMPSTLNQPVQVSTGFNQQYYEAIKKQTFSRNTALTTVIAQADALTAFIPDPLTRLKAAITTAGAGRSAKEIADAVQIHLSDVDAAVMQFQQAVQQKAGTDVKMLRDQADMASRSVEAGKAELDKLNARIAQVNQQIQEGIQAQAQKTQEADSKQAELQKSEAEFKTAAEAVRNELNTQKTTILSTIA